jgi:predicted PurR-regulated permease PerM
MSEKLEQSTFLILLALVTVVFGLLLTPFWVPLLWACIIAVLFHPVQVWLEERWGSRPNITALGTLLAGMVLVVIPVLLLLADVVRDEKALSGQQ